MRKTRKTRKHANTTEATKQMNIYSKFETCEMLFFNEKNQKPMTFGTQE